MRLIPTSDIDDPAARLAAAWHLVAPGCRYPENIRDLDQDRILIKVRSRHRGDGSLVKSGAITDLSDSRDAELVIRVLAGLLDIPPGDFEWKLQHTVSDPKWSALP